MLMNERYKRLIDFIITFFRYLGYLSELVLLLVLLIVLGGVAISFLEGIKLGDAIYFSFITGMSIGYGDIHPATPGGKIVSIAIGIIGMLAVGISVAIGNRALADTVSRYEKTRS